MKPTTASFRENAAAARGDGELIAALGKLQRDSRSSRENVRARLPEFDAFRDEGVEIKNHTLANLDTYLEIFERNVVDAGGIVHWCRDAAEARAAILGICRARGAKTVAKGKSMVSEEIALNDFLEENGVAPIETDLGEYILQLRHETPSHLVMPAIHLTRPQWTETFRGEHTGLAPDRPLETPPDLTLEARTLLREKFLAADVGITGANFLVAETGSAVIVTNEGNGDLTHTLPKVHIVLASIEKMVPAINDVLTIVRILARSATGQEITCYTSVMTGPKRAGDLDGPEEFHVVLLDNGRSKLLKDEFREVLRCIKCGACQSLCPVYGAIGGHAYGWVYGGPIGSVITPALVGLDQAYKLPEASSFCGRCQEVCPMRIPLPGLMRKWRERAFERGIQPAAVRSGIRLWAFAARRPALYHFGARIAVRLLALLGGRKRRIGSLPLASGWTATRDLPAPQGHTFQEQWRARRGGKSDD